MNISYLIEKIINKKFIPKYIKKTKVIEQIKFTSKLKRVIKTIFYE